MAKRKQTTDAATGQENGQPGGENHQRLLPQGVQGEPEVARKAGATTRYWPAGSRTIRVKRRFPRRSSRTSPT